MSVKDIKTWLSRRSYLKGSAALLAGATMSACGGGGEEDAEAIGRDEIDSIIDAARAELDKQEAQAVGRRAAPPPAVVDLSTARREIYFIEVAVRGPHLVRVDLSAPVGQSFRLCNYRPATANGHSLLHFATLDTTPTSVADQLSTRQNLMAGMTLSAFIQESPSSHALFSVGQSRTLRHAGAQRFFHADLQETEWLFAFTGTATSSNWNVAVRFFRAVPAETGSRRSAWVTEIANSEPNHRHHSGTWTWPLLHPDLPSTEFQQGRIAGIIANSQTGGDTLVIPSHRHANHFELLKPLCHSFSSMNVRAHAERRIFRHLDRYSTSLINDRFSILSRENRSRRFHNEVLKTLLGGTMAQRAISQVTDFITRIRGMPVATFQRENQDDWLDLQTHMNSFDHEEAQRRLNAAMGDTPTLAADSHGGGFGTSVTGSVRIKIQRNKIQIAEDAWPAHVALRFDLMFARMAISSIRTVSGARVAQANAYRIRRNASDQGYKLGATFVLGPLIPPPLGAVLGVDLEVSMPMTILGGSVRIDSFALDLAFDINLRSRIGQRFENFARDNLLNRIRPNILSNPGNPPPSLSAALQAVQTVPLPIWAGIGRYFSIPAATNFTRMVRTAIDYLFRKFGRTWTFVEVSPVRFSFINPDVLPTYTGPFRSGWRSGSHFWAWTPGVKFISAAGFEAGSNELENAASAYLRVNVGADAWMLQGNEDLQRAMGNTRITI